jgi:hypothetical protein
MANGTAVIQMALAHDSSFLDRVQYLMTQVALVVLAEVNTTPNHTLRVQLAHQVLNSPGQAAVNASVTIVGSANLVAANTTVIPANPETGTPQTATTDATDAAILSQISTLWSALAGVST